MDAKIAIFLLFLIVIKNRDIVVNFSRRIVFDYHQIIFKTYCQKYYRYFPVSTFILIEKHANVNFER
jgi:hypothetical protein